MDIRSDEEEQSISSLISNSINSQQKEVVSPEDIAWADSCLVADSEISESKWNSMKDALLESIDIQPESLDTCSDTTHDYMGATDMEVLSSDEEGETAQFPKTDDTHTPLSLSEAAERSTDDAPDQEESNVLPSSTFRGNPFQPTYNEDVKESGDIEAGLDSDPSTYETEPSYEEIFRVWELNIPSEEYELDKQLNKALTVSPIQSTPSKFDDSEELKGLEEESIENLIASISDLSLSQNSR